MILCLSGGTPVPALLVQSSNTSRESTKSHDAARNPKEEFRNVAKESRARRKPKNQGRNPIQEFRNVARESTKSHNAARNPKQEFRHVARESRARRKPTKNKKEFRNVAQARNTNQEFRKVAVIAPAIKDDGKYVEKDNEILRTKNDSKRMLLKIFHEPESTTCQVLKVCKAMTKVRWVRTCTIRRSTRSSILIHPLFAIMFISQKSSSSKRPINLARGTKQCLETFVL